ncbi:amidohydrolase [Psychromicrobium silvestre]|uniref:Peptidase M20 domain-containing protein 2 n=1 Tax=Psychromicrobium silvestre TaxID=1645614 RepID=A0A7Y9LT65_9MICC|nr:M20 family metallopeptidase [Psychromicrobium silvestre]NYE95141.1 amidohydrolase [Psychromicrobium silvestre]
MKQAAAATIQASRERLIGLSERIHSHPETAWQEHRAAEWVGQALAESGFTVTNKYLGLETALFAKTGTGQFRIGLCAEYDALPGLGHACGHNLIAAIAVGAAIALAPLADELDATIEVYGTPAEEGGGGKIEMLKRGAFKGLDLAMMAHPAPLDAAGEKSVAVSHSHLSYHGKAAHAAAFPEHGVNAADAFTIAQVSIGLLRQQLPSTARVHGVVTNGGDAPNAIPEHTEGRWYVRAPTLAALAEIAPKVRRCFEAGALATGCELEIIPESEPYAELRVDEAALAAYLQNAEALGRHFATEGSAVQMNRVSTDMGNVSHVVPTIHPYIGIGSLPALNHQKEFAAHCVGPAAELAITDAATALAWTAIDMAQVRG